MCKGQQAFSTMDAKLSIERGAGFRDAPTTEYAMKYVMRTMRKW